MSAGGWLRSLLGAPAASAREIGARGARHFAEGRLEEAETDYRQAWSLEPGYAEMPYHLGLLADARGDRDAAVARLLALSGPQRRLISSAA